LAVVALLLVLVYSLYNPTRIGAPIPREAAEEISRLRYANALLQQRLGLTEAVTPAEHQHQDQLHDMSSRDPPNPHASLSPSGVDLIDAHRIWDWKAIVQRILQPWPVVTSAQLTSAVAACNGSAMYCQRFQVVNGQLYVTDYAAIFFDRHYAPARVLPLLDTLRRHPKLPNLDIVVAGNDEPRVHVIPGDANAWGRMCKRYPGGQGTPPPALFSSTTNPNTLDLPWLDFAWFFPRRPHKLRTPPWSVLHPQVLEAGGKVDWGSKIELAMHTGNVGSPQRKLLSAVAREHPHEVLVNELFIGDHQKIRKTCEQLGLHRAGGFQQHKCYSELLH
jgi:hypothetical protein